MGRFIDLAIHGGCSRKLDGIRLEELLKPLGGDGIWPDAGLVEIDGLQFVSTVDVVLPMIDDPTLFGQIVIAHALSDVYAASAEPLFAVNVLGLPAGAPGHDDPVREMLASAASALRACGAVLLGGHSIEHAELLYGLAATGRVVGTPLSPAGAQVGDVLVLTKPLGTSVATAVWKDDRAAITEFSDVVTGMTQTNRAAAELMRRAQARACTDVTGFGFLGHLHNLLRGSGVAARVDRDAIPRYESTIRWAATKENGTRLLEANEDFVFAHVHYDGSAARDGADRLFLYDAQVSGGLLGAIPSERSALLATAAEELEQPYWQVGVIQEGAAGDIILSSRGSEAQGSSPRT
jgi:selenide, water dikinase